MNLPATGTAGIELGAPVVVARAPRDFDRAAGGWGRWQFPCLGRLADGGLHASFSIEPDSYESGGKPMGHAYSSDGGGSWRLGVPRAGHEADEGILLPNGDRLKPVLLPPSRAEELDLPPSVCLMRTMDGNGHGPLYLARSTDGCGTWSRPAVFDGFGKMPQLLALG